MQVATPPTTAQSSPYSVPPQTTPQTSQYADQTSSAWNAQPVRHHWFYLRSEEKYWIPFSLLDSNRLEEALQAYSHNIHQQVSVMRACGVKAHLLELKAAYFCSLHCA